MVKLRLHNRSDVDLAQVHLRPTWSSMGSTPELWRKVGMVRRGAMMEISQHVPAPPGNEDQFQIEIQADVGSFLRLELWSDKVDVEARARPSGSGGVNVVFKDSSIHGDRPGFGQIVTEGSSGVGHVVNVHGSNPADNFQKWLAEDVTVKQMRELLLFVAREICQPWTSHCGIPLCGIASGGFMMGASPDDQEAEPEEKVRRDVSLSHSFWMARHPVTIEEYSRVTGAAPLVKLDGHHGPKMPAACVTWREAMRFCEQLTCMEYAAGGLPPGYAYCLPTEAQWEYACRAGSPAPHYGPLERIASVKKNLGGMGDVERFQANAWGLHDMLGLVFEWCLDVYAPYRSLELADPFRREPELGQQLMRVVRGGCYQGPDVFSRASARYGFDPMKGSHRIGFRIVLLREQ